MTVTFFINYLNHHQVFVADEMFRLLGDDFRFVATYPRNPKELKGGVDYSARMYCLLPAEREQDMTLAHELNLKSDVCVFGAGNLEWEKERALTDKLSFEISERWFKRGLINIFSPRLLKWWWLYQTQLKNKQFYKLCASAYTASDCEKLFAFKNKCFKWGYFTESLDIDRVFSKKEPCSTIKILWVARFLQWKHPEMMLQAANRLLVNGCTNFHISMIGEGSEYENIKNKIERLGLEKYVSLLGPMPNNKVLKAMQEHDVFCFTSDKNEGWGAVLNEAMNCGCAVIANKAIGSVPYLIENMVNGYVYDGTIDDLVKKIRYLLTNHESIKECGRNARNVIKYSWNPHNAAVALIDLIGVLLDKRNPNIKNGPCSLA